MIKIYKIVESHIEDATPEDTLTLSYAQRQKCTQRVQLDSGKEAGLMLPRSTVLCDGDILEAENGLKIRVCAAQEDLSVATCRDQTLFAKACYHLGNRHTPAQIGQLTLLYQHDHVMDDMLIGLGLTVQAQAAPFFPENGAYHKHGNHIH